MARRLDEPGDMYRDDHGYREDRGAMREPRRFMNRAAHEVRSWFGGHDGERERMEGDHHALHHHDHMSPEHTRMAAPHQPRTAPDPGPSAARWEGQGRWSGEHDYGYIGSTTGRYGERWSRDDGGVDRDEAWRSASGSRPGTGSAWDARPSAGGGDWRYGERWPAWGLSQADRSAGDSRGLYEDDRGGVHQFAHRTGMNFAGRGPKGYRRSDERIREDVCDRLTEDWQIDASEMDVMVANGEVTLAGAIHSREEKRAAEDLVESIAGVREIHNNLRVSRPEESVRGREAGQLTRPEDR